MSERLTGMGQLLWGNASVHVVCGILSPPPSIGESTSSVMSISLKA